MVFLVFMSGICHSFTRMTNLQDSSIVERSSSMSSPLGERSSSPSFFTGERIFPSSSLCLRVVLFPSYLPGTLKNFFTVLSSCVAVCTRPKETAEFVSTITEGRSLISMSHWNVTNFQILRLFLYTIFNIYNFFLTFYNIYII